MDSYIRIFFVYNVVLYVGEKTLIYIVQFTVYSVSYPKTGAVSSY